MRSKRKNKNEIIMIRIKGSQKIIFQTFFSRLLGYYRLQVKLVTLGLIVGILVSRDFDRLLLICQDFECVRILNGSMDPGCWYTNHRRMVGEDKGYYTLYKICFID